MNPALSLDNSTVPSSSPSSELSDVTAPNIPLTIAEGTGSLKIQDRETAFSHTITKTSSSSPLQVALSFVNENVVQPTERFLAGIGVLASYLLRREMLALSASAFGVLALAETGKAGLILDGVSPTPYLNTGSQLATNGSLVAIQIQFNGKTGYGSGVPLDPYDVLTAAHVVESSIGQTGTVTIVSGSNYLNPTSMIPASGLSIMPGGYGTESYSFGSPDLAIVHTSTPIPGVTGSVSIAAAPTVGQTLLQGGYGVIETPSLGALPNMTGYVAAGYANANTTISGDPSLDIRTDFGFPNSPNQNIAGSGGDSGGGAWTLSGQFVGTLDFVDNPNGIPSSTEIELASASADYNFIVDNSSAATPEPGTFSLFVCAAGYFLLRRRREHVQSAA